MTITLTGSGSGSVKFKSPVRVSETISIDTTLNSSHYLVLGDATSGDLLLSLPEASTVLDREYIVKKIDATSNKVSLDPFGSELIDDLSILDIITKNDAFSIKSIGTGWVVT